MRPHYHRVARARATNSQLDDPEIPRSISGGVTGSNGITTLPLGYRPAVCTCSQIGAVRGLPSGTELCRRMSAGSGRTRRLAFIVASSSSGGRRRAGTPQCRSRGAACRPCWVLLPMSGGQLLCGSGEPTGASGGSSRRRRRAPGYYARGNGSKPHAGSLDRSIKSTADSMSSTDCARPGPIARLIKWGERRTRP